MASTNPANNSKASSSNRGLWAPPCTALNCPIGHPHSRGIYIHEDANYASAGSPPPLFYPSFPPPVVWDAVTSIVENSRHLGGDGQRDQFNVDIVIGFVRNHLSLGRKDGLWGDMTIRHALCPDLEMTDEEKLIHLMTRTHLKE